MRTRANKNYVASVSVFTSVVARRASLALSNALGARMCQGTFFVLKTVKILIPSTAGFRQSFLRQAQSEYDTSADLEK